MTVAEYRRNITLVDAVPEVIFPVPWARCLPCSVNDTAIYSEHTGCALREVLPALVLDCLAHRTEPRSSWGAILVAPFVEATVRIIIPPPVYKHG